MQIKSQQPFTTAFLALLAFTFLIFSTPANAQCTANISIDSLILCNGDSTAALSSVQLNAGAPLMISEVDRNSPDLIEIQNVTGAPFDATGYYVACSDDYSDINEANTLVWNLSGVVPAGWIEYKDDNSASGQRYWGNNLFFNGTSSGWVAICDPFHNVVDILFWEWESTDIATFAPIVAGNTITLNSGSWIGDGFNVGIGCSTGSMTRSTNNENNDASDWTCGTSASAGVSNMTITPTSTNTAPIVSTLWSTGDTTQSINNLGPGTYVLTIVDSLGCNATDSITISSPAVLVNSLTPSGPVLCFGDSTGGMVTSNVSGGVPGYSYVWSNGDTDSTLSGIGAGWYSVTVFDSNGCSVVDSAEVIGPSMISVSGIVTDELLGNDGAIDLTVTGGTGSYSYSWTNGAPAVQDPGGLAGGVYDVTITDSNGCSVTASFTVGTSVSIEELSYLTFSVFPNPSDGIFEVQLDQTTNTPFRVELINSIGQVIYMDRASTSNFQLDARSTEPGLYFIRLSNNKGSRVVRATIK